MGGRIALPEYDENLKRAADIGNLTPKEVAKFLKYFKKLDKEKKGTCRAAWVMARDLTSIYVLLLAGKIKLTDLFESIEDGRTLYTDTLCELVGEGETDHAVRCGAVLPLLATAAPHLCCT